MPDTGGQTATSQQTSSPPAWLNQANQFGANQARTLYNSSSPAYYPGSTVANQSPATQAGNQGAIARAVNGSPVNSAAGGYLQSVLGGQYMPGGGGSGGMASNPRSGTLPGGVGSQGSMFETNSPDPSANARAAAANAQRQSAGGGMPPQQGGGQPGVGGNPYTDALNQSIFNSVNSNVESQMSLNGRYGSPTMGSEIARQTADAIAPQVYGNYQNERGLQQQAAGLAPTIANQDWTDINQLQQTGAGQDQFNQNQVNANVNHWNYNQNLDFNKLSQYMGLINGANVGTSGTTTQSQPGGGIMGILGGLAGGLLGGL